MPPADCPNPGATSKSGANDQSSDMIIHVANGATVEYIKNNTAIHITNSDGLVKKYRILPRPPNVSGPGLQEKMRCKGTKAVKLHNNYLDFQTKVRADTMTALKGKTDIKWKDCPSEAKALVGNALKYRHPYCFRFDNNWAGKELMRCVLANKRDTLNNKTPEKRAEATKRKLKATGKQPATRANGSDEVPLITTGTETLDTEANGDGSGNPERTVNHNQTPNQAKPNKGKDGDKDNINSNKEVERRKETNRAKPRPKMIQCTETGEAPEGPADKPDSPVPSTVGRTSSPGPSGTTVTSDIIGGSSKRRKTPDKEEPIDSEDKAPVKPTKTSQAKGKETEKTTPVEVPVPTASAAKAGKNKKQKLPAAKSDDSEGKEVARPTKKANTAKKPKATVTQDEETNLEGDDLDMDIPVPAANTTENKQKVAANKGEKVAPTTKKRKEPEPEPNSSDLLEDEGEEPVVPKPNGKNGKLAAGAKASGKKQTLAQQDSWNAGYAAEVAELAQKMTSAQKQEATKAANKAAADKVLR